MNNNLNALLQGCTLRKPDNSAKVWMTDGVLETYPQDLPLTALAATDWECESPAARGPEQTMRHCLERLMMGQQDSERMLEVADVTALMTLVTGLSTLLQHKGLTVPFLAGYVLPRRLFDAARGCYAESDGEVVLMRTSNLDSVVTGEEVQKFADDLLQALAQLPWVESSNTEG